MLLSWTFAVFVLIVVLLHNGLSGLLQNGFLLVASYLFYAYWDWRFLGLLWLMTTVTWFISRRLTTHKRYLYVGILFNLLVLGIFKYAGFFVASANSVLLQFGVKGSLPTLEILLPIGISFYSFRLMSYLFDANQKRFDPQQVTWLDFALYVAFFPQIISGPIERATGFLPRLRETRRINQSEFIVGLTSIFIGLYYKVAIADPLVPIIDSAFKSGSSVTSLDAAAAVILFSTQLYADFAGYTAIAIGISRWLGLPAMENFRQPYFSQSIIEFWTRWHISLSTWFRDYLFFPVSRGLLKRWGSKRTQAVQVISYMVTMLATGLWHGANLTFVVWGGLHGIYMSIESILARIDKFKSLTPGIWQKRLNMLANILLTQVLLGVAWVFFRAESVPAGVDFLWRALTLNTAPDSGWWVKILVPLGMVLVIDLFQVQTQNNAVLWHVNLFWRAALCAYMLLMLFIFSGKTSAPFVYLHF